MANKNPTTKRNTNKSTRLGHDPFEDTGIAEHDNKVPQSQNIKSEGKNTEIEVDDGNGTLFLPSRFSIATVGEVYKKMSSFLNTEQSQIDLEAGEIESIDTSAIQLLYAFSLQAKMSEKNLHWKSRSKIVDEASKALNIDLSTGQD